MEETPQVKKSCKKSCPLIWLIPAIMFVAILVTLLFVRYSIVEFEQATAQTPAKAQ